MLLLGGKDTAQFAVVQYSFMIAYMVVIILYARSIAGQVGDGGDLLATSRVAHRVSGSVGAVLLGYAWMFLFGRQRSSLLPAASNSTTSSASNGYNDDYIRTDETATRYYASNTTAAPTMSSSFSSLRQTTQRIRQNYPALQFLLLTVIFLVPTWARVPTLASSPQFKSRSWK